jgi:hypothetical protein
MLNISFLLRFPISQFSLCLLQYLTKINVPTDCVWYIIYKPKSTNTAMEQNIEVMSHTFIVNKIGNTVFAEG